MTNRTPPQHLVIIGQGYVGLPLAMRAAEVGYRVTGFDTNEGRISALSAGRSYVEDISDITLQEALTNGTYCPTSANSNLQGFDIAVITVPTPLRDGAPDLSYVEQAAITLAPYLRVGAAVVLESTTYPGTTTELVGPILEAGSGLRAGTDFRLGYSPERIDPGNKVWTFRRTPKVVSGIDSASLEAVQSFYDDLVERTVPVSQVAVAELTKLLENTFRHVNIALINEMAMFSADLELDIWEAIEAASSKPFGFMPFVPGPGVGGHCLPIDPSYLSWRVRRQLGRNFRFVELANDINDHMPEYIIQRVMVSLNRTRTAINGSRILLLGLAYKRNTGDARESPALTVANRLLALGADVRAADPYVDDFAINSAITRVEATVEEAAAADMVVLLTDHDVFDLDELVSAAASFFDARHRVKELSQVEYL